MSRRLSVLPASFVLGAALTVGAASPASAAPAPVVASVGQLSAKTPFPGLRVSAIKNKSAGALRAAKYFHVTGNELDKTLGRASIDFQVSSGRSSGRISSAKGTFKVIRIGTEAWFSYDAKLAATMKLPADAVGSWCKINNKSASWGDIVDLTSQYTWYKWIAGMSLSSRAQGKPFTGTPTIRLVQPGKKGGSLYVATSGPAFPRYAHRNDNLFTYSFFAYNVPFSVEAPSDKVVDLTASA